MVISQRATTGIIRANARDWKTIRRARNDQRAEAAAGKTRDGDSAIVGDESELGLHSGD